MIYDNNYVVAIDFDNTITLNSTYKTTGTLNPIAKKIILKLKKMNCILILWTSREKEDLKEALNLIKKWKLPFDYINEYPLRGNSRKINVDMYIDDKNPCGVQWKKAYHIIKKTIKRRKRYENKK